MRLLKIPDLTAFSTRHSLGSNYVLALGNWQLVFCPEGGFPIGSNPFVTGFGLHWFLVLHLNGSASLRHV